MRIVSRLLRKLGACFHTPPPVSFEERRLQPVSRLFGFDRGMPLDRYYIEKFLQEHSSCITGEVLEVAVKGYGNVFVAKAFLDGLSVEDVNDTGLLDFYDEDYTITIGVFARK